jgi:hypothetical protein
VRKMYIWSVEEDGSLLTAQTSLGAVYVCISRTSDGVYSQDSILEDIAYYVHAFLKTPRELIDVNPRNKQGTSK